MTIINIKGRNNKIYKINRQTKKISLKTKIQDVFFRIGQKPKRQNSDRHKLSLLFCSNFQKKKKEDID